MARSSDSDEEDDYVTLGTPLAPYEEDEAAKKPFRMEDMVVKDKQGRQRFHGAFTGGFSAGFFNTVGSKEGFTPSTFVSSRSQPGEKQTARPEDFMDDEDMGEFGIAPKKFATAADFTSQERSRKRENLARAMTAGTTAIPGEPALLDLVVPETTPVGVKLLKKMGWRPGQGVGPRIKKKKKKKKPAQAAGARVYGCALPPGSSEEEEEDSDEHAPEDVTFAPKDTVPISFKPKDDLHGIGYRGLDPSLALTSSRFSLFDSPEVTDPRAKSRWRGKKGIRGQAFGVGAFEEEDEDIYSVDSMSNYDMTMEIDDSDKKFGWTAPRDHSKARGSRLPVGYVGKLLEGFLLSAKPLKPKTVFPRPQLPRNFRPIHHMRAPAQPALGLPAASSSSQGRAKQHTALSRTEALGETPIFTTVFDLVSDEDKARMEAAKMEAARVKELWTIRPQTPSDDAATQSSTATHSQPTPPPSSDTAPLPSHPAPSPHTDPAPPPPPQQTHAQPPELATKGSNSAQPHPAPSTSSSRGGGGGLGWKAVEGGAGRGTAGTFKPFSQDPDKQARYDNYLRLVKSGHKDPYEAVASRAMTAWEREREKEEFGKAARFYKPLSFMMASRFTKAKYDDNTNVVEALAEEGDQAGAAKLQMYGQLTHEELEWHPAKLVCKRFNVPDPYPSSCIEGLPTVKRDKLSIFNFLTFDTPPNFAPPEDAPPPLALEAPPPPAQDPQQPSTQDSATAPGPAGQAPDKRKSRGRWDKKPSIFSVLFEGKDGAKKQPAPATEAPAPAESASPATVQQPAAPVVVKSEPQPAGGGGVSAAGPAERQQEEAATAAAATSTEDAPPPADLFRAIFKNSDSELSSSESSEEEGEGEGEEGEEASQSQQSAAPSSSSAAPAAAVPAPGGMPPPPHFTSPAASSSSSQTTAASHSGTTASQAGSSASDRAGTALADFQTGGLNSNPAPSHSRDMPDDDNDDEVYGPPLPPPPSLHGQRESGVEMRDDSQGRGEERGGEGDGGRLAGLTQSERQATKDRRDRSDEEEVEEFYGPALPPPSASSAPSNSRRAPVIDLTGDSHGPRPLSAGGGRPGQNGAEFIDLTRSSSKKHKHRDRSRDKSRDRGSDKHRERSKDKAKKSKKSKHKKQKHKKERHKKERHKERKKRRQDSDSSEDSEADSEESDRETDRSRKPLKRPTAADFM